MFLPLRVRPVERGRAGRVHHAATGSTLAGTYLQARTDGRAGVLVFCHEFLSDRWSYRPYADHLRDLGFDIFTFDFRNHGESQSEPGYQPLHWVTDHEVRDLHAALAYLRTRPDHDPAGFGLFGVSRGGARRCWSRPDEPRRLGRDHRRRVPDDRDDDRLHPPLGRDLHAEPVRPRG